MIALLYIALGALGCYLAMRKPKEDPTMGGRIIVRAPITQGEMDAWTAANTARWHENEARRQHEWEQEQRFAVVRTARYKLECAKFARERGYGSNAEVYAAGAKLHALQGDLLAVYK
jgi:hypothetical protein